MTGHNNRAVSTWRSAGAGALRTCQGGTCRTPRSRTQRLVSWGTLSLGAWFVALLCATPAGALPENPAPVQTLLDRTASAKHLISDGITLLAGCKELSARARLLCSTSTESAPDPGATSAYEILLGYYHDALSRYLQHRQEVQQHANQFHQQAQIQKALATPLTVPSMKPIAVQAQDLCAQMQIMEHQLQISEVALKDTIETLINNQGNLSPGDYAAQLRGAMQLAAQNQAAATSFDSGVQTKANTSRQQLHDQTHLAFISGDYVQSENTFSEVERREAIVQEEVRRAGVHSFLANQFLLRLKVLAAGGGSSSDDAGSSGADADDPDDFAQSDAELEKEYQRVQYLYSLLHKDRPGN